MPTQRSASCWNSIYHSATTIKSPSTIDVSDPFTPAENHLLVRKSNNK